MESLKIIRPEEYTLQRWKNGLGFTEEIAIFPPQSNFSQGEFLWRLSTAKIEQSSSFSLFPHHDRILVVLSKDLEKELHKTAIRLTASDSLNLPPLVPYTFSGNTHIQCDLIAGPVKDLNLFFDKKNLSATAHVFSVKKSSPLHWRPKGHWNLLFACKGPFEIQSELENSVLDLKERATLVYEKESSQPKTFVLSSLNEESPLIQFEIFTKESTVVP